jgi:hypothetical protein
MPSFARNTPPTQSSGTRANPDDFSWVGDHDQIGAFWRDFETLWLPTALLQPDQQRRIADALYGANRHWGFEIQFDKGLAEAPDDAIVTSRETATNPAVLTAFCLALISQLAGWVASCLH